MYPEEVPRRYRSRVSDDGTRVLLADSELPSVPKWLAGLIAVADLDLSRNQLTGLPDWIADLTALTRLDLFGNRLTALPDSIGNLTALTRLDLFGNRLTALPESIGNLTALTELNLFDNRLTALPDSIGNLTALTRLDLDRNQLTALPDSIGNLAALTELSLNGNRLTALPESIGNLTALTRLDLTGNQLTALPEWIGTLSALTELNLTGNQLTAVPESIRSLSAVTRLDLDGNQLTALPKSIASLTALTRLDLTGNQLTAMPEAIPGLTALTRLDLDHNQLTALSDSIGNLTALTEFDLTGNRLTALPESIGNLTALTRLDLDGNQLTALPDSIGTLTALTELGPGRNQLTALPESIGNLTALTRLDLGRNQLTALPESIGTLTALTELGLGRNQLTALPDSIGKLTALTRLDLFDNRLAALPKSIGNLSALTRLDLDGNQLTALPKSIGNLSALTELDLDGNQLTALPKSIKNLNALTQLGLGRNQLTALPESIENLTALTELDLTGNQLTSLPRHVADRLTRGLHLNLSGNPLDDPLPALINRGADALAAYLGSLKHAVAQYEAKLLLVGEGKVGKTSLVAALRGGQFVKGRPTTHGIEIWPLTIRHPKLDVDMTLRAWDFGGQEVYRITHQFFFSRRALYLVVWNAREGQEQDQVEDWLRRIRLRVGRDARTMVVATHCDERLPELDYPRLKQTFPDMLVGSFEVDSRTGTGIRRLHRAIGKQAARLPQMGQVISPRWVAARGEILARSRAKPQIRYDQFAEACGRHGVTGPEIVTLAQLMHDLGHIIYYGEDEGLKDVVVLDPEWLTKAISYVLEDKETRDAGGVLDHARLRQIWQERADGPAYPARYHPYFLRLMEKFDVSYRLEDEERHSLVAQLVPHERPALPWQPRSQPPAGIRSLALICRLDEPAPGLIPWLTVRHHHASTGMHWRRGVFLRHPIAAYASEALLELYDSHELAVEVRAPSPDLYFNVLRESIENLIARRWPGLGYRLQIPCPTKTAGGSMCPGLFLHHGLLRLRERGHTSIACQECAETHEISLLLTGFAVPGQPLLAELHDELARLQTRLEAHMDSGLARVEGQAAETAEAVRRVMRVVSAEITDCPRLFTFATIRPAGVRRVRVHEDHYRLTLWCEHPGYWHPWLPASYELDQPKEWFAQIRPYIALVSRTLKLVIPLAGSVVGVVLPPDQLERARGDLDLMNTLVGDLPGNLGQDGRTMGLGDATGQLIAAEGQALRAIRAVLFEHDRGRAFGGLRRVQAPTGDFLWVCPSHYPEYDPGLPTVP